MNYFTQKHGGSLLFVSRSILLFYLLLCSSLQAQDSLSTTSLHVEGGATVYSADSQLNENSHKNFTTDYKSLKTNAVNNIRKRTKTESLSGKLAKIERQKIQKSKEIIKSEKIQKVFNLPQGKDFFMLYSSKKNCAITVYYKKFVTSDVYKIQKFKKKEFCVQKIPKINFKSKFQKSAEFAFSYYSRPPPSLC